MILMVFVFFCANAGYAEKLSGYSRRVLLINSYHPGFKWADGIVAGLQRTLETERDDVELFIEYLDTKRIYDERILHDLYEIYQLKYKTLQFDVVVASDDNAYQFVREFYENMFSGVPFVFCGISDFDPASLDNIPEATGIIEVFDFISSIMLIRRLHPDMRRLNILIDNTETGQSIKNVAQRTLKNMDSLAVSYIDAADYSRSELIDKVASLPESDVILAQTISKDRLEHSFSPSRMIREICSVSAVPVYAFTEQYLGEGIVGGKLNSGQTQGMVVGDLVLRILDGEKASEIPVYTESLGRYKFDFQVMKKHHISEAYLPEGSELVNRPLTFYQRHYRVIWPSAVIIVMQMITITMLWFNIRKRNRAEKRVTHLVRMLHSIRNVNQLITRETNRKRLLQGICDNLIETSGFYSAWILLINSRQRCNAVASAGVGENFGEYLLGFMNKKLPSVFSDMFESDGAIVINKEEAASKWSFLPARQKNWFVMGTKLHYGKSLFGLLCVSVPGLVLSDPEQKNLFEEVAEDVSFVLQTLAQREKQKKTERTLERERNLMQALMDTIPDKIFFKDRRGRFLLVNNAWLVDKGLDDENECAGKTDFDFFPEPQANEMQIDELNVMKTGKPLIDKEQKIMKKGHGLLWNATTKVPLYDRNGRTIGTFGISRDITEKKHVESQLQSSLREKEILLKEVHHRVKNNMQVISSLLNLQSNYAKDIESLEMFRESRQRVLAMARVHEKMYQSHDFTRIDFCTYVREMADGYRLSYPLDSKSIDLQVNGENVFLSMDYAIPAGLVVNELISNALKHAFPQDWNHESRISVDISIDNEKSIRLSIKDNGIGLPEMMDFRSGKTLGLQLVYILVEEQLEGKVQLQKGKGTHFVITFGIHENGEAK